MTQTWCSSSRRWSFDWFDPPLEDYSHGNTTGIKLAGEFLSALRSGSLSQFEGDLILREVTASIDRGLDAQELGKSGAAVGFMYVISGLLVGAAQHLAWEPVVAALAASSERRQHELDAELEGRRKSFPDRMRAAKAAKRAKEAATVAAQSQVEVQHG